MVFDVRLFIIAIISTFAIAAQNYLFAYCAAALTAKLRMFSFRAILRQDIEFFDRDEHSVSYFLDYSAVADASVSRLVH